jgi:hydroxymethylpyrimidine/phosphomethylpyrimidine kinase
MQATNTHTLTIPDPTEPEALGAYVLVFNVADPTGAGGVTADAITIASVGAHALAVVTGSYVRDTTEIMDHYAMDDEAISEQGQAILEDIEVDVIKVGFVGSPDNLSAIAELTSDYADVPVIAYMPDLSWWREDLIDQYQEACTELLLPQTTLLVGNYNTLVRWLMPDWTQENGPTARDIARAAHAFGVPYTLVTGMTLPNQYIENVLCSPNAVLCSTKFERLEASFTGAGDTLSAALAGLLASGTDLNEAVTESLTYLDRCLEYGFRPGMGHVLPDRLFWAHVDEEPEDNALAEPFMEDPDNATRH